MRLSILLAGLLLAIPQLGWSQITIQSSDYTRAAGDSVKRWYIGNLRDLPAPAIGAGQTWNYGQLALDSAIVTGNLPLTPPAEVLADFPTATYVLPRNAFYSGVPLVGYIAFELNATGLYELGYFYERGMNAVTQTDSLVLPAQSIQQGLSLLSFPMSLGVTLDTVVVAKTDIELYLPSFGLPSSTAEVHQHMYVDREVVGDGSVIVPSPSGPLKFDDVVYVRTTYTRTDTFYVDGALAPAALLSGLGVSQGIGYTEVEHVWVGKGENVSIFAIFENSSGSKFTYVIRQPNGGEPASILEPSRLASATLYPNPSAADAKMRLSLELLQPAELHFTLTDLSGRQVLQLPLGQMTAGAQEVTLSAITQLGAGLYVWHLTDGSGLPLADGRLLRN